MRLETVVLALGLLVALGAAGLLFLGIIESGPAAVVGIVGLGLMGTAGAVTAGRRSARS